MAITLYPETRIVTGYDHSLSLKLTTDGTTPVGINPASVVKAILVTEDRVDELSGEITVTDTGTGSNWATGDLVIPLSAALTAGVPAGPAALEISVSYGGVKTPWYVGGLNIVAGHIA